MAGKPGMKGGGGARPGAGRKPKQQTEKSDQVVLSIIGSHEDPKEFLIAVMNDVEADAKMRVDAAKALMPFIHQKKGEGGKKDAQAEKAADVARGKFAPAPPPRLVVSNGRT